MLISDFQYEIAARTIWMEARGEGSDGIVAVAWVIVNRLNAGKWYSRKTLAGCCLMSQQFSCWNTSDPNRLTMAEMDESDAILQLCRLSIKNAATGIGVDPTDGATHYYDSRLPFTPVWAVDKTPTVKIGHHLFFKGIA